MMCVCDTYWIDMAWLRDFNAYACIVQQADEWQMCWSSVVCAVSLLCMLLVCTLSSHIVQTSLAKLLHSVVYGGTNFKGQEQLLWFCWWLEGDRHFGLRLSNLCLDTITSR